MKKNKLEAHIAELQEENEMLSERISRVHELLHKRQQTITEKDVIIKYLEERNAK